MKAHIFIFFFSFLATILLNAGVPKIDVSLMIHSNGERLSFESDQDAGFVLFQQGNSFILAFDIKDKLDITSFSASGLLSNVELIPSEFIVVKFDLKQGYFPKIEKNSQGWFVDLETKKYLSCKDIPIDIKDHQYILPYSGIAEAISFQDPVTGDDVYAFPTKNIQECVKNDHHYIHFSCLKTLQGIVIKSKIDNFKIEHNRSFEKIYIDTPEAFLAVRQDQVLYGLPPELILLDFSREELNGGSFYEKKVDVLHKITVSSQKDLLLHRLNFSKFLISWVLGSEAFDYLKRLKDEAPQLEETPDFLILFGLSALLCDQFEMAIQYLSSQFLNQSLDALFYLNLAKGLGKISFAQDALDHFFKIYPRLSNELKIKLGLKTIAVAIDHQLLTFVRDTISLLLKEGVSGEDKDMVKYYQAMVDEQDGLVKEAGKLFQDLGQSAYSKVRALVNIRSYVKVK